MTGPAMSLRDISDVNIDLNTVVDESILVYDANTKKFLARELADVDSITVHNEDPTAHGLTPVVDARIDDTINTSTWDAPQPAYSTQCAMRLSRLA